MTEGLERRSAVLDAEDSILKLHQKIAEYDQSAQTLKGGVELLRASTAAMKRYDASLDQLVKATTVQSAETHRSVGLVVDRLSSVASQSIATIEAAFTLQREGLQRAADSAKADFSDKMAALGTVITDVRSTAKTSADTVLNTYADARVRFERARDEFVDGRKEVVAASGELRATLLRLEESERAFQAKVAASVRRIERTLYAMIVIAILVSGFVMMR